MEEESKKVENKRYIGLIVFICLVLFVILLVLAVNVQKKADNLINVIDNTTVEEIVINDMTNTTFNKTEFIDNITPEGFINNASTDYNLTE